MLPPAGRKFEQKLYVKRDKTMKARGPHFLGIGAQKAGTTWLHNMLSQNNAIWLPPIKELHYFDEIEADPNPKKPSPHARRAAKKAILRHIRHAGKELHVPYIHYLSKLGTMPKSNQWYYEAFNWPLSEGKLCGELTPAYCSLSLDSIRTMRAELGLIKLIFLMRDPVSRAKSQMRMWIERQKRSTMDLSDWDHFLEYPTLLARSNYQHTIQSYEAVFGPENILYLAYGEISSDPYALLARVEKFLEVPAA
ncbi:MAG: sulfotransferase, partial [Roseibium sp.]